MKVFREIVSLAREPVAQHHSNRDDPEIAASAYDLRVSGYVVAITDFRSIRPLCTFKIATAPPLRRLTRRLKLTRSLPNGQPRPARLRPNASNCVWQYVQVQPLSEKRLCRVW